MARDLFLLSALLVAFCSNKSLQLPSIPRHGRCAYAFPRFINYVISQLSIYFQTPIPESEDLTQLFDLSPEGFPWNDRRVEDIKNRRADMSDLLIFDILLLSGEMRQPSALWPPMDVASLQRLLAAIEQSKYDGLKKDCLIYFLLKWHQDDRAASFKETRCIPPQFSALSDAFWHLDTGINVEVRPASPSCSSHALSCVFGPCAL